MFIEMQFRDCAWEQIDYVLAYGMRTTRRHHTLCCGWCQAVFLDLLFPMTTIRDVAKHAGVAPITASRALSDRAMSAPKRSPRPPCCRRTQLRAQYAWPTACAPIARTRWRWSSRISPTLSGQPPPAVWKTKPAAAALPSSTAIPMPTSANRRSTYPCCCAAASTGCCWCRRRRPASLCVPCRLRTSR